MLRVAALPFCRVVLAAPWDEPPARRFAAYRCRDRFRRLLGHAVIDEFATLSAPIFFGPERLAGQLYNAGLSLAHRRDPEMAIDLGWPPLVAGLAELPAATLADGWEQRLLAAIETGGEPPSTSWRREIGGSRLERLVIGEALVWATDAPLLPHQLGRLCELSPAPLVVALGMRPLKRSPAGREQALEGLSERRLEELLAAAGEAAA